jgi:hypothetical protein
MHQVTSKCADQSAVQSGRRSMSSPSAALAMKSATSCAVEQGNVLLCETALDHSETEASKMTGPSKS